MDGPIRVLLVEDSLTDTAMVGGILAHAPEGRFVVDSERSLAAGLERLSGGGYDIVLLDLHLPDSAGLDTLAAAYRCAGDVPIVVLTGSDDELAGTKAVENGAQDYVLKGRVDARVLSRTLTYAIERQQVLCALRRRLDGAGDAPGRMAATTEAVREFVAVVAHEIRSPLGTISLYAELLRGRWDTMSVEQRLEGLDAIMLQARYITRLTDDLLATEQLETGALRPRPEPVVLAAAIADALELTGPTDVPFTVDCSPGLTVWADAGHVRQMLVNYTVNARRHGAPPFTVRATVDSDQAEVRVGDCGDGVPPDLEPALFTRFARGARPGPRLRSTGLGLSIVRGLAEANGGGAWYERPPAGGSEFVLRLPLAHGPE